MFAEWLSPPSLKPPAEAASPVWLICTSLLGPILPLNPLFTEYLLGLCGVKAEAAHREAALAAYEQRLQEFRDPKTTFAH